MFSTFLMIHHGIQELSVYWECMVMRWLFIVIFQATLIWQLVWQDGWALH